jgi:hypothetical protein
MIDWTIGTIIQLGFAGFSIFVLFFIIKTLIYFINGWLKVWLANKDKSYILTRLERIQKLNPNVTITFKDAVEMDKGLSSILEDALKQEGGIKIK